MNKYQNFSVEDFLQDEFFNSWVKRPDRDNTAIWEDWLAAHPEMVEIVQEAKSIISAFDAGDNLITEEFYKKLKHRINFTITNEVSKPKTVWPKTLWVKLAAVFAGLIIAAGVLFYSSSKENLAAYSSAYGETKKVLLPDGSEVVLNANSSLKYANGLNKNNREIWLNGEGFFKIKHIENLPKVPSKMIVHASDVDVEVVGTEFNINAGNKKETEVLLTKGKVRLFAKKGKGQPVNMQPNELALYDESSKNFSIKKVAPANYVAWIDHKYIFEKTSLKDLCREIQRYYGTPVTIEDPKMAKQLLSGTLELQNEDSLTQTLSVLLGVQINKKSNKIIIYSKPNS